MEFLPIVVIALLFWLLLIRPASKRQKELSRMQSSLHAGDQVMLSAGIFATVVLVDEEAGRIHVEVAPGTTLQVARGAIAQVVESVERADGTAHGEVLDARDDVPGDVHDDVPGDDGRPGEQGPRGDR